MDSPAQLADWVRLDVAIEWAHASGLDKMGASLFKAQNNKRISWVY
jgi:hypothetical protein